ncbi:hypothetical protein [Moritella viscosa]|uniref:hypothetical protein n=1 Tax=Moritella viscosa TaxID=80854 RepID=UPI00091E6E03|nr:hypothetical protein [Moritella viscosa]SGY90412.1 Putative uncharacterized protein [Moritella viscosa]SGY90422.1 Putative uncharacterized protein [Moritella viscosa]
MLEDNFVTLKSKLLIRHTQQFMNNKLSYAMLCDYIWEILQDWQRLNIVENRISSQKEMVFWYLVFELQFQDETSLLYDKDVSLKLHNCILFLQNELKMPKDCIGVRPNYA